MRHKKSVHLQLSLGAAPTPRAAVPSAPAGARRFLVAALPCFRLERCGWGPEEPVVLVAEEKSALRVQVASRAAAREGLQPFMTVSEARALLPGVEVELADPPELELADLQGLLRTLERVSPHLRALPPQRLAAELTPMLRRRGVTEAGLLEATRAHLEDLGHVSQIAVADDIGGAAVLAGWWAPDVPARHRIVPPGGLAEALGPLPLEALAPSPTLLDRLHLLGVRQVAELARLDAASISGRFGAEGLRLHRLSRGTPADPPMDPAPEQGLLSLRQALLDPVLSLDAVCYVLAELTERLCEALGRREEAAVRLQLRLGVEGAADFLMPVRLGRPRREPRVILRLLQQRLEGVQLGGAVTDVSLTVLEAAPFLGQQQGLFDRSGAQEPLPELLARLTDALGPEALYQPSLEPVHRPEGAWAARPAEARGFRQSDGQPLSEAFRPPTLLRELRPARVTLGRDLRPRAVELDGDPKPIAELQGPERLQGAWWSPDPFDRDYFVITLEDGRRFWLFFDREAGEWWVQGAWG
ncbi:MAG: DNA polymerase Y family protein [Alphaproteobacteria bacterium]|nr:DNA polymerase Y family protein [Alphaproteobacteria bacterium]